MSGTQFWMLVLNNAIAGSYSCGRMWCCAVLEHPRMLIRSKLYAWRCGIQRLVGPETVWMALIFVLSTEIPSTEIHCPVKVRNWVANWHFFRLILRPIAWNFMSTVLKRSFNSSRVLPQIKMLRAPGQPARTCSTCFWKLSKAELTS